MTNDILNSLLRDYERKKLNAELDLERRKDLIYKLIPRLLEIDTELNSLGIQSAKSILFSPEKKDFYLNDLNKKIKDLKDEKELAEHNMLVDLARNDIGRIAKYGSVYLEEYMKIHRFSKVMHIASTVCGELREDKDSCDTVSVLLPAGTLSGAPKFRACEIIDELEKEPRGVYGGAIGYIDLSGNLDVCIAIRTAIKKGNKVYVQAGAGIVADSVPESEYMECAHKAGAVIDAIKRGSEVNK